MEPAAQLLEINRDLRKENRALLDNIDHLMAEARTLRQWIRDDAQRIAQLEDIADRMGALLAIHGHTPTTTPILALLKTLKSTQHTNHADTPA